jgi:photosystem II stability/assembly factor-like uncharacterized protein
VLTYNGTNWVVQTTGAGSLVYHGLDTYLAGGVTPRVIITGSGGALRTFDGTSWLNSAFPETGYVYNDVFARRDVGNTGSNGTVIAVGSGGRVYKSTNHGGSWVSKTAAANAPTTLDGVINIPGTSTWYIVGAFGTVLKSVDDGESWTHLVTVSNQTLYSLAVSGVAGNANRLWVGGGAGTVLYSGTAGQ